MQGVKVEGNDWAAALAEAVRRRGERQGVGGEVVVVRIEPDKEIERDERKV